MPDDTARALVDLVLAAGNIVAGVGSTRHANGTATITSTDSRRSVTALVPANWVPGPAIAFFDQGSQRWKGIAGAQHGLVDDRLILSERHRPTGTNRDIGLVLGLDIYEFNYPNAMLALRERGRKINIPMIDTGGRGFQYAICDIDEGGQLHAFIPVLEVDTSRASRGIVSHNGQSKVIQFPANVLPYFYPSQCRSCNDWFWSFPVAPAGPNPFGANLPDVSAERGFTFSVFDLNEAADLHYFDIAINDSGEQGSYTLMQLGRLTMSGSQATYPGGPTYPFYYDYEGIARNTINVEYSSIPSVQNIGPLDPPVEGDELAEYPIYVMYFSSTIGGIVTPLQLIINGSVIPIIPEDFSSIINWFSRAILTNATGTEPKRIRFEFRGPLYEGFEVTEASLTGSTGRVTYGEGRCTANYTLPMLVDTRKGLMIAERFDGSTHLRIDRKYETADSQATANEAYCTESGTHETFYRSADGTVRPIDGFCQHQLYIHQSSLPKQSRVQVGQSITVNYEADLTDAYLNPDHPEHSRSSPAMVMAVPGLNSGVKHWGGNAFDRSEFRTRTTHNTPRPDHLADLQRKLAPGAKVYGILWENQSTFQHEKGQFDDRNATIFKGIIKSSSLAEIPLNGPAPFSSYGVPMDKFMRMLSPAMYALASLDVEVTEIVSETIRTSTWQFFGDYWWNKIPYSINAKSGGGEWSGQLTLDGSIRNIYTTEAYNAAWIAHAFTRVPRWVIGEGTFEDSFAACELAWADPYVWRLRRFYNTNGHYEGWVQGREGHPMEVPRWKLDYSGNEVRCWFDGVSTFDLKAFDNTTYAEAMDFVHIAIDRKKALEQLQQGLP